MNKYILGLDVGIASVGWAIVEKDTYSIIDSGVRLFQEGTAEDNAARRTKRGTRRLTRRRKQRLEDFIQLSKDFNIIVKPTFLSDPLSLRIKGLTEKLTNDEIFTALYHIIKYRGTSLETVSESDEEKGTKGILNANEKLLSKYQYVCLVQKYRLDSNMQYRGNENTFKTENYVQEAVKILSNQDVPEAYKQKVIDLIKRRRHFSEGPGSEKSPTPYGRYFINDKNEIEFIDLIEKMRGRCSVFNNELRAPKNAPSVELFNFLNDLNNMNVENKKITQNQKNLIINNFIINGKQGITVKQLAKFLEIDENEISGLREDASNKKLLTEFVGLKKLIKQLPLERKQLYLDNFNVLDKIANILTSTKIISEREEKIKNLDFEFMNPEEISLFANVPGISGYHSLSFKAIYLLNQEMMQTNENQIQILYRLGLYKNDLDRFVGYDNIPSNHELIINPVVQRSLNETIKIINSVRKKFGELDSIVIEMARDKNSKEVKKRISNEIKKRNETNKQILDDLKVDQVDRRILIKLLLYHQQEGKCLYTGTSLDRNLIMSDPYSYHIDHIIPISVSYDDSLNNKVLVLNKANTDKGNLTPIMAFNNHRFDGWDKETYISNVNSLHRNRLISNKKKDYLLYEKDITKYSNMGGFIQRNLVDTRYASRGVLNILQNYFKANDIPTKVFTIRGNITSVIRNKVGIVKDRDDNYLHHAIDAATIALLPSNNQINKLLRRLNYDSGEVVVENISDNPVITQQEFFEESFMKRFVPLKELAESHKIGDEPYSYFESEIKISHKVDRKPNRKLADDTIYSTRKVNDQELVVKKYQNIYDAQFLSLAKDIADKKYDKYLMYHHDPKTFEKLIEVVESYLKEFKKIKKINPFNEYFQQHGKITKYAKNNNGPEITAIKFYDGQLGSHVSLSSKQKSKKKNVVLLQIKPYRTDFYRNEEGIYKFITIRMHHVRYSKSRNTYYIDSELYNSLLEDKGVDNSFEFQFSMHRNEYLLMEQKILVSKNIHDINKEIYRYIATNNDDKNVVEVKPINYREQKRIMKTIGRNIIKLSKYHSDNLGNLYLSKNESLKLEFKIGIM